jgi:hypothetical protein
MVGPWVPEAPPFVNVNDHPGFKTPGTIGVGRGVPALYGLVAVVIIRYPSPSLYPDPYATAVLFEVIES